MELHLDFPVGARFACPRCGGLCPVHDTALRRWRHLDFFQHEAHLSAPAPRVRCPEDGVLTVEVAWARAGSGFTLLFEALVMTLASEMPVAAIAGLVGEHDTRLWRVIGHYVEAARAREDWSPVSRVGLDETSFRRGQDYVSVFADLDRRRVVYAIEGETPPSWRGSSPNSKSTAATQVRSWRCAWTCRSPTKTASPPTCQTPASRSTGLP